MAGSGSLLRLFQSEFFDSHLHMHYLLTMEQSGVQDYLVNQLYKMTDDDIDFYLPQLCQIALLRYKHSLLHRFLLDKAAHSMHFALKIYWLVQAVVEDRTPELLESAMAMVNACEAAMVNSAAVGTGSPGSTRKPSRRASSIEFTVEDIDHPTRRRSSSGPPDLDRSALSDGALDALSSPTAGGANASAAPLDGSPSTSSPAGQQRRSCTPPGRRFSPSPRRPNAGNDEGARGSVLEKQSHDRTALLQLSEREALPGNAKNVIDAFVGKMKDDKRLPTEADAHESQPSSSSRQSALRHLVTIMRSSSAGSRAQAFSLPSTMPNPYVELGEAVPRGAGSDEAGMDGEMRQFMLKQRRCDYFNTQSHLVAMITKLSTALTTVQDKTERVSCLTSVLNIVNRWLLDRRALMAVSSEGPLSLLGLHIPVLRRRDTRQQVLCTHPDMCRIFASASRAPFMLVWETANLDEVIEDAVGPDGTEHAALDNAVQSAGRTNSAEISAEACLLKSALTNPLAKIIAKELGADVKGVEASGPDGSAADVAPKELFWRYLAEVSPDQWQALRAEVAPMTPAEPKPAEHCTKCRQSSAVQKTEESAALATACAVPSCPACRRVLQAVQARHLIWGESWKDRVERARRASPYGHYRSWTLDAVVVKGADDLRQELLAAQVVRVFIEIFKEARLPLWLKETEVLVTSSNSGLLEFIYDSSSIDSMKKRFPGKSLAEIFKVAFADKLFEAKQNFIESCAAYSLLVWFLQVKDRHNGNLMILSSGHVIHIDFGFMLSNSPGGNFGFESSPFKLTQEFLDVMDGECSDQYEYFRTLVIRGFLEARKHMERIILPIRMMLDGSKMPCFREGPDWVLQSLHDRFFVNLTEEACIEKIVDLIDASVNNWRTIQYDTYQRIVNGIL